MTNATVPNAPMTQAPPATTATRRRGAIKGAVAAAAGTAVLLGGVGTFALWNVGLGADAGSSQVGSLQATFDGPVNWQDVTPNAANQIYDITAFRMVPGDVVQGTVNVNVTTEGENLLVDARLNTDEANLPAGVEATVTLDGTPDAIVLGPAGEGVDTPRTHQVEAVVELSFDSAASGSMTDPIDLSKVKIDLQQRLNS